VTEIIQKLLDCFRFLLFRKLSGVAGLLLFSSVPEITRSCGIASAFFYSENYPVVAGLLLLFSVPEIIRSCRIASAYCLNHG
jgi:hypothetical protein